MPAAEITPSCDFISLCLDNTIQSDWNNWKRLPKKWPVWKHTHWKINISDCFWDHGRTGTYLQRVRIKQQWVEGRRFDRARLWHHLTWTHRTVRMRVEMRCSLQNYGCLGNIKCQVKYTAYCSHSYFNNFQLFMSIPKFIFCLYKIKRNQIGFILFFESHFIYF